MAKKNIYMFIFIMLIALLPILLDMSQDCAVPDPGSSVAGDLAGAGKEVENINYYALFFAGRDEIPFEAGEKIRPEPEPEPEPEPVPEPRPAPEPEPKPVPVPVPEPKPAPPAPESGSSANQKEQQLINFVNEARRNAGLAELRVSSQLITAARAKSKDMADNNYFSHHSPVYGDLAGLMQRFGISYRAAGENLAMNSNGSVSMAHNSLMGSAGHRSNILSSNYTHIGIGIAIRSDGYHYYTQLFTGQ